MLKGQRKEYSISPQTEKTFEHLNLQEERTMTGEEEKGVIGRRNSRATAYKRGRIHILCEKEKQLNRARLRSPVRESRRQSQLEQC